MKDRLFHISEEPNIRIFKPRPSSQYYEQIESNVVFAISERMLHNYLLPRDCPRVTYYAKPDSQKTDINKFFDNTKAKFIINVEEDWLEKIQQTTLYSYELSANSFVLLDECAGYYISYKEVIPTSVTMINNIIGELQKRKIELRFVPSLFSLADDVSKSSLNFSIIRMRNAKAI